MVQYKDFKIIFDVSSDLYMIYNDSIVKDFTHFKDAKNWIDDYINYKNQEEIQKDMQEYEKKTKEERRKEAESKLYNVINYYKKITQNNYII